MEWGTPLIYEEVSIDAEACAKVIIAANGNGPG